MCPTLCAEVRGERWPGERNWGRSPITFWALPRSLCSIILSEGSGNHIRVVSTRETSQIGDLERLYSDRGARLG